MYNARGSVRYENRKKTEENEGCNDDRCDVIKNVLQSVHVCVVLNERVTNPKRSTGQVERKKIIITLGDRKSVTKLVHWPRSATRRKCNTHPARRL